MNLFYFPIARIGLWFVSGIVYAYYCKPSFAFVTAYLATTAVVFLFQFIQKRKLFDKSPFFGIALYLLFFGLGIGAVYVNDDTHTASHYTQQNAFLEDSQDIEATVCEKLKSSVKYTRYVASVTAIHHHTTTGKVLVYVKNEGTPDELLTGTRIKVHGLLKPMAPPSNPDQFDYSRYLASKNIYAQVFCSKANLKIGTDFQKNIFYYTSKFRNTILENLKKQGFRKEELAVTAALILGQQQDISPEIMRDYQYAGAVHILSVSGLHVGFILLFLTFLLKPLPKTTWGNTTRFIIIVLALWIFACIAGLAPSVVRSVTMYSFVAFGMLLQREISIYQTLIGSLFIILLFEPLFLFDVGFLLSYLALFFIVWFQPELKKLWHPKHKISSYFWDILTVSFAAQLGTLPLSLYYFHQFPSLFFVTNIVLIPCLSIIMFLGVLACLLAYWNIAPEFLVQSVEKSVYYVNQFIRWIASWESFIIKDIPLNFYVLTASYLLITAWIIWLKQNSKTNLKLVLGSIVVFIFSLFYTQWLTQRSQQFLVCNVAKETVLLERNGDKITLYAPKKITSKNYIFNTIKTYATAHYARIVAQKNITNTYFFRDNKIMLIDSSGCYQKKQIPDAVILSHSPKVNLARLVKTYRPKVIIADASNYKSYITLWKETCRKENIPFHSTYEKGYYAF